MDSALELRKRVDNNERMDEQEAQGYLTESPLVASLTDSIIEKPLFYVWRLIALSEIPFARSLPYTQSLIDRVYDTLATPYGLSLSGTRSHFLPCYNAMMVSALCRLGEANSEAVGSGVKWIVEHQPMRRGISVSVPGFRFDRYGGCFNDTPCIIGLAKSVMALLQYRHATGDDGVTAKLDEGTDYLLAHRLIYRLSEDKPITTHILDISFPESYHLNIVELIQLASLAKVMNDPRTQQAKHYLASQQNAKNGWNVSFRYKAEGYRVFDQGRGSGDWVTHVIRHALKSETGEYTRSAASTM